MTRALRESPSDAAPAARRWLLFVHQLPSSHSNLRVRTWRRLQQLGAVPVKQAVHVLPDTPASREDFEWLKAELTAGGGDAIVFAATTVDPWSDDALVEQLRGARAAEYAVLERDLQRALKRPATRRPSRPTHAIEALRSRLGAIESMDTFGSPGRDRVAALLAKLEERSAIMKNTTATLEATPRDAKGYRGRLWVTRPRPGVDRMSSAWLIRRFVDPQARFGFAADWGAVPAGAIPFDMFGVDFSHQGDGCTFETLCRTFGIDDPATARLAGIVHDLDLKEERYAAPEAPTVAAMIEGLRLSHDDDQSLLTHGMTLFESLYRSFERAARPEAAPRISTTTRTRAARRQASRKKR